MEKVELFDGSITLKDAVNFTKVMFEPSLNALGYTPEQKMEFLLQSLARIVNGLE